MDTLTIEQIFPSAQKPQRRFISMIILMNLLKSWIVFQEYITNEHWGTNARVQIFFIKYETRIEDEGTVAFKPQRKFIVVTFLFIKKEYHDNSKCEGVYCEDIW